MANRDRTFGAEPTDYRQWWLALGCPVAIGVVATLIGFPLAIAQAAGGHGPTWLAAALFPFAMVVGIVIDGWAPPLLTELTWVAVALLTLPTYGVVIGLAWLRQIDWLVVRMLVFLHLVMAAILIVSGDRFT